VCDYSVAPVARYWRYWHKPMLSPGAMAHNFGENKSAPDAEFGLLTRVGVTFDSVSRAVSSVLTHHHWNNVIKVRLALFSRQFATYAQYTPPTRRNCFVASAV